MVEAAKGYGKQRSSFALRAVIDCPKDGDTIVNGYLAKGHLEQGLNGSVPPPVQKIQYTFSKTDTMGVTHSEPPVVSAAFGGTTWDNVALSTGYTGQVSLSVVLLLNDMPSGDPDVIGVTIGNTSTPCS